MRQSFEEYFDRMYPGMSLDGPTAFRARRFILDEWHKWQIAFMQGQAYQISVIMGTKKETKDGK